MNDVVAPSPDDTIVITNPLKQAFTIKYNQRPWTLAAGDTVSHPWDLAVHFAGEMTTAIINAMGDKVRETLRSANPNMSLYDLNRQLIKSEPRTNDRNLRKKVMKRIVVEVDKLYPRAPENELEKGETAIAASSNFYSMDEELFIELLSDSYAKKSGLPVGTKPTQTTERITTDISEFASPGLKPEKEEKVETTQSEPKEEAEKLTKKKKQDLMDDVFEKKEVLA